jgi:AhpD family alkylhydroperoxidase
MTTTQPRIAPGTRKDVGLVAWTAARIGGRVAGTQPLNLFLTLGRQKRLFLGWLHFSGRMMPGGTLKRRETELVILRVSKLAGCDYEHAHHVHLAAKAGVTEDVTRSPREDAILAAVDQLHARRDLDDDTWATLRTHLDERECVELILLVGNYELLATAVTTLRIQNDARR